MRLKNKVVLMSGSSRGIGRATAELFAQEGARVYVGDLSIDEPFTSDSISFHTLDVTQLDNWQSLIGQIIDAEGRIDVLFNNAGMVKSFAGIAEIALEDWNAVIQVNQTGPFYGMRTVIPHMRRAGKGSIINTSSIWGIAGVAGAAAYTASKAAVRHMSKNAALTYVEDGIRVNSIHPGIIETPMVRGQDKSITAKVVEATPMKRMGQAIEIAYGVLFLASDESSYMTGAELVIDGGSTAL